MSRASICSRNFAVAAARRCWGRGASPSAIRRFSQLEGLGAIADKGSDHTAKVIKVGKSKRVVHPVASALTLRVEAQPEEADSDAVTKVTDLVTESYRKSVTELQCSIWKLQKLPKLPI